MNKGGKLKNSVLQMAMEGKLVSQNENDEPAYILVKRIYNKKAKMIKNKEAKDKTNPSLILKNDDKYIERAGKKTIDITDEIPFEIPESWSWIRLFSTADIYTGNSINKTEKETRYMGISEGYNYIATKDVSFDNNIDYENGVKIPGGIGKFRIGFPGSILLCIEGGSAGRKIAFNEQKICFGNKLANFQSFEINNRFLFYYLQSPLFKEIFKSEISGIIGGVGVSKIRKMFLPVPPLEEQQRIVEKIEEVLPLVEKYGVLVNKLEYAYIYVWPQNIRKSILQEAIRGKLTKQILDDEPASVLLEKIRKEKEKLIREKKIKRNKNESIIYKENDSYYEKTGKEVKCIDDEIPFKIPDNWAWTKLKNVIQINPKNSLDEKLNVSFVPMTLIDEGYKNSFSTESRKWEDVKSGYTHFAQNDIGVAKITPCFQNRKSVIFNSLENEFGAGTTELHILRIFQGLIDEKYLLWFVKSSYFIDNGVKSFTGTAGQKRVGKDYINECMFPLPPLEEQKRIAVKLNKIFLKLK